MLPHIWAELVDDVTSRSAYDVKHGEGPPELHGDLVLLADLLRGIEDRTTEAEDETMSKLTSLLQRIQAFPQLAPRRSVG